METQSASTNTSTIPTTNALPYHEPDITTILIQTSFLLLLNTINHILDTLIYCGLLGQVFIGVLYSTPGAQWLSSTTSEVLVQLGYLGLILIVYEGGLSTSYRALKANFWRSTCVAVTGIVLPIGFSYVLISQGMVMGGRGVSPVQAFAAGAALCSTSLGTTFTVLGTSGLMGTRMGVVLTSAAMMDDVVGLVMVQIISNLGNSSSSFSATTVVRPVFVSIAFGVVVPLTCWLVIKPATLGLNQLRETHKSTARERVLTSAHLVFLLHTATLIALVTGASYAGTSNLFAAYLAGAVISWWDSELPHPIQTRKSSLRSTPSVAQGSSSPSTADRTLPKPEDALASEAGTKKLTDTAKNTTGEEIFRSYFEQPLRRILKPFFFASIGFSIPITRMFSGAIVWRGIVYTVLMVVGKLCCGLWLVRMPGTTFSAILQRVQMKKGTDGAGVELKDVKHEHNEQIAMAGSTSDAQTVQQDPPNTPDGIQTTGSKLNSFGGTHERPTRSNEGRKVDRIESTTQNNDNHNLPASSPLTLYPACIVGMAMVARGEIGFLISSLAQSNGVFSTGDGEEESPIFLIVTWAIVLCTVIGPVCVGLLVRRMKRLEKEAKAQGRKEKDVLGAWGDD